MTSEENLRTTYGVESEEMDFQEGDSILSELRGDINEPLNYSLANFEKEFLKNEKVAIELFSQLNESQDEFYNKVAEYIHYEQMDIVKLMKEILLRYKNWVTALRQNVFVCKDEIEQIRDIIENDYVKKSEYDDIVLQAKIAVDEANGKNEKTNS